MNENNINSFTFYRNYYELLDNLSSKDKLIMLEAIVDYVFKDKEPELKGLNKAIWINIKLPIDKSKSNSKRSQKQKPNENQTKTELKLNENQSKTKQKPNENQTHNQTKTNNISISLSNLDISNLNNLEVNKGVIGGEEETFRICKKVVGRLNELTNSNFRATSKETVKLISDRLSEGYTEEDLVEVVEKMVVVWNSRKKGDKDMSIYLRPSTLFRPTNFENYLNMKVKKENVIVNDLIDTKGVFDD